jgi:signal transduction histidine kinase
MAPVDLNRLIRSTLVVTRNEYKFVADVKTDLQQIPPVTCHGGDVAQVLLNVIVNAAHAVADSVKDGAKGEIFVGTSDDGEGFVDVVVRDTGCGIPENVRERIFDPFFTTKQVGRGTGQGLSIARAAVEKHGGTISFDTDNGRGTTFRIRLPIEGTNEVGNE